jgi:hypothetical protein
LNLLSMHIIAYPVRICHIPLVLSSFNFIYSFLALVCEPQ